MKRHFIPYLFLLAFLGIVVSSCRQSGKVLDRKKMENVMYDVYVAESMMDNDYQTFSTPQKKEAFIHSIFEKHKITQVQWDSSLAYYSDNIALYLRMNDSVKIRIQKAQSIFEKEQNQITAREQAIEQMKSSSYIPATFLFSQVSLSGGLRFRLDSMNVAQKITEDDFSFSFDVFGMPKRDSLILKTVLVLEYKDTTIYREDNIAQDETYKSKETKYIKNDTLKVIDTLRTISGFVRLQPLAKTTDRIGLYHIHLGKPKTDSIQNSTLLPATEVSSRKGTKADIQKMRQETEQAAEPDSLQIKPQ